MADVAQKSGGGTVATPFSSPMNLTCMAASAQQVAPQYAIVIDVTGHPKPPDSTWTLLPGFNSPDATYHIQSPDKKISFDIPAKGIAIYTK